MKVKEIMRKGIIKIKPDVSILNAAKLMSEKEIGSLVVEGEENEKGIITERDFLKRVVAKSLDAKKVEVREVMSKTLITIDEEESVDEANRIMHDKGVRRLPVTQEDEIVGMVTMRDVARSLMYSRARDMRGHSKEVKGSTWG